jgi:hypothetical protein
VQPIVVTDLAQDVSERGQAVACFLWEIGAAEKRSVIVVCQEHRERPTARSLRQHLLCDLINPIDIRPLFSVDFDVDKPFVQDARYSVVLERLVSHNVAPMTGGVTDAEVNRLLFTTRALERLFTPGVPIDWIFRVLKQVGTRL